MATAKTVKDDRLVITESGFLTEFVNQHTQRPDRPFCFILGAGVSRPSGIPSGVDMAAVWLREMYEAENFGGRTLEDWATAEHLGIPAFDVEKLANFYPQLYRRRYGEHEQAGYAFLESQMEGKEPSYGYSVLAYLLSETPHRVVVTTNFDNLVADALSIHSSRFPLVVGHDALAQFAAVELRRPLVAKIHGALGFAPKSRPDDIEALPEGWKVALRRILERYTPIVIGYEGNDGSLMSFLQSLPADVPDRLLWCVYAPGATAAECMTRVSPEVREYVASRRGRFTPIRGFDELMAKVLSKLREKGSVPDLYERLKERARQRELNYDNQQRKLFEASLPVIAADPEGLTANAPATDASLSQAVTDIAESRKEKPWWVWSREADEAPNPDQTEAVFQQALEADPENPHVLVRYALFFDQVRNNYDAAEELYQRAERADPDYPLMLALYGDFLERKRKDMDKAEQFYQRAIKAKPDDPYSLGLYAFFLQKVRNEMSHAGEMFERAIRANPNHATNLRRYAQFLVASGNNTDRAEEFFERSVAADPQSEYNRQSYAEFLRTVRKDPKRAEEVEKRPEKPRKGPRPPAG